MTKQIWIVSKDHSDPDFGPFDTEEDARRWMKYYILNPEFYILVRK